MDEHQFGKLCSMLKSSKVIPRREACDELREFLRERSTIDYLNENSRWDCLHESLTECLLKEYEKATEDSRRKGLDTIKHPQSADVWTLFIRLAVKDKNTIDFIKLCRCIIRWLVDPTKELLQHTFLKIVSESLLVTNHVRDLFEETDWKLIFCSLKSLCVNSINTEQIECLSLVVKFGPLHSFPVGVLRQQFPFITKICNMVTPASPKPQQHAAVELVREFCLHTAKDNRMACCKLGEDIFLNFISLYQGNANEDKLKANLIEFFLFQVVIHNPRGVKVDSRAAYAVSEHFWKQCFCYIFDLLTNEITENLQLRIKNQSLFVCENGINMLFGGFVQLFVEVCRQLFKPEETPNGEPPPKRTKREFNITNLTDKIIETKSWAWLNLTYPIIKTTPEVVTPNEYIELLKSLSYLQAESKNPDLLHHINKALIAMLQTERLINVEKSQVSEIWNRISEFTLRSISYKDESIQVVLQLLVENQYLTSSDNLLQFYKPGSALNVSTCSLNTLDAAFRTYTILQSDRVSKRHAISWILQSSTNRLVPSQVAEKLIFLILKQWPNSSHKYPQNGRPFEDIEDVYFNVCFEELLIDMKEAKVVQPNAIFCVDQSLLFELTTFLEDLIDKTEQPDDALNICILIFNVLSYIVEFKLMETDLSELSLFEKFTTTVARLFTTLKFTEQSDQRIVAKMIETTENIKILFSTKICAYIPKKVRELVPQDMIRNMFQILNWDLEGDIFLTLKKNIVEFLVVFSCDSSDLPIQEKASLALLNFNYDFSIDDHYELGLALFASLVASGPITMSEKGLHALFDVLQNYCEVRYNCYTSVHKFLDFFHEFLPVVVASGHLECKKQFVGILYVFYSRRMSYGPSISVKLLKCMSLFFELEPTADYANWDDQEIILKVPKFLHSDYQEVRFAAIKVLISFFKISSKTRLLNQYQKQEMMISKIYVNSLQVLDIEGNVNDSRIVDEVVTRTSSIFHTFASVILASNLWIEEALFTLLKIVCDRKFDLIQVQNVLDSVGKNSGFNSGLEFLEKYLIGLVNRWKSESFDIFPFKLFSCSTKIDFFSKYWSPLAYVFIANSKNELTQVASGLKKTKQSLIEDACPKLLSYCISQEVSDFTNMANNCIYRLLRDILGIPKVHDIAKNKIEEIILCMTDFVCDEKSFEASFGKFVIFPKVTDVRLSVDDFEDCLDFVETTLYNGESVVSYLMKNNPEKIHFILLQLNLKVNSVKTTEDKLRYFHIYFLVSMLTVNSVLNEPSMQLYLLRDLTYTLLHNIKDHQKQPELSEVSCIHFKKILQKILPALSGIVAEFFRVIFSRLKYVALENCIVSPQCVDMLEFLVTHKNLFITEIEKLDCVPATPEFHKIFNGHKSVKYNDRKVTFEDEIVQFLDSVKTIENFDECEYSVKHLHTLLSEKKDELQNMCSNLRQTRGLSEDCEKSNLHKLICTLITLSCSNGKVSTEAVRCLGEIGPSDLATLILQPEKAIVDVKWTPWELVLGCGISLLSKYLVDADVGVIKAASDALFQILAIKEGRKVAESENDFGFGVTSCKFFTPFILQQSNFKLNVDADHLMNVIQNDNLWIPDHCCHEKWITKLVCTFLGCFENKNGDDRGLFQSLIAVCKLKVEFCEQILPLIVYTVLFLNTLPFTTAISSQIEIFFNKHWDITISNSNNVNITTNKSSVQCMLNVIHFIRLQKSVRKRDIKDMKLDYLKVAKAAHFCTAHFTALLYAELWCQEKINQAPNDYALSTCSYTKLDLIYDKVDLVTGNALQNILRQAYKSVGETDALLGCGTSHLLSPASRVEHYKELGRWDQVTQYYERQVSLGCTNVLPSLVDGLQNSNMYQLSLFCSQSSQEPNYESLWRLGQWSYNVSDVSPPSYNKSKFSALKALHENEEFILKRALDEGRGCVVQDFMVTNMESIKNFYTTLGRLQCLKEIEEFAVSTTNEEVGKLLYKWSIQDDIVCNDYQYMEPIQSQRILLLTDWLKSHTENCNLMDGIVDTILSYAQRARIEGNSHVAFKILEHLRLLHLEQFNAKIQLEEAQICWSVQDVVTAKCILRQLSTKDNINPKLHAMALKMTGKWMVESSSENRQTIIENYFVKSLNLIKKNDENSQEDEKCIMDTWDQLAKFTDHEYQEVLAHIKSDVFQKKKQNMLKAKDMVNRINVKKTSRDFQKAMSLKKKFSCIDEIEISNIETDKNNMLILALRYYLRNLITSDNYDMTVFRVFSLLLENRSSDVVKPVLERDIRKVPTHKFINILPQIIPHISSDDLFSQAVNNIIERCAQDHPYHTLPLILSLALSHKDREYSESKAVVNDTRSQSAKAMLTKLKSDPKLSDLIEKMEFVSEAVIELAYQTNTSNGNKGIKVARNSKILKIKNYDDVLLPTYNLPVRKSCDYSQIVGIHTFSDVYFNVGGINAPKRITCQGTDGIVRTQLVKGQDDLRQDAVMQQVFTIMNKLLNKNKQTKNLRIRTYRIVALSMRSGILEWVDNTMPIAQYLTGDKGDGGAHVQFRPMDKNPMRCRVDFKNSSSSKSNEERLRGFNKICENIKPVFHKFFETNFPQPTVWYERRRTYIHSVATSSMCGYILGIGDRHLNNILIDKNTAEVVHIDFGIAFEQGRVLPTPETIPFRLTRDIVDGMGVSGVEGVFRRSCEKTVEVLRLHYQTIITILEVLLYDPLYDWTVSTAEANKRQKDEQDESLFNVTQSIDECDSRNVNDTAERALLRLRAKLQGSESGKSTSVEHQVGTLIQQAVDPSNLCRLFYGWQPYL